MAFAPRRPRRLDVLRALLAALVVANLLFFAFTRGALEGLGLDALGDREPERLAHQVRPESIRLLPTSPAASAVAETTACFETPVFTAVESAAVETVLAANLPAGAWTDVRGERVAGPRTEATHLYRVASADAALATKLPSLKLDASGRGFSACAKGDRPR
jgi:hypothetical protein